MGTPTNKSEPKEIIFPTMVAGTIVWIARMPEIKKITSARQVLVQIMELHEVAQVVKDVNELVDGQF